VVKIEFSIPAASRHGSAYALCSVPDPVSETSYKRPSLEAQERFKQILERAHIPTTIRFSKGRAVDAACGQLRRRVENAKA
jgi:adenine C2-methylase RlmN of 23S rRNA A2503 and tRNA A37